MGDGPDSIGEVRGKGGGDIKAEDLSGPLSRGGGVVSIGEPLVRGGVGVIRGCLFPG